MNRISSIFAEHVFGTRFPKGEQFLAVCPICGGPMESSDRAFGAANLGHAQALRHRYDFFECPNEDLDWHRAAVEVFRQVVELWSRPPLEVLKHDAADLFRTRFSSLPIP